MINILDFGADKSGRILSTSAFQAAFDKCEKGGCVYVPEGLYKSGGNAVYISGLPEMHCENITLENITAVGKFGMKAYFTDNLKMKNVDVTAREGEDYVFENVIKKEQE